MIRVYNLTFGLQAIQSSSFSPILLQECKRVPGMTWDHESSHWVGYPDAIHLVVTRCRARGLRIETPPMLAVPALLLPLATKDMRDYQVAGAQFLLAKAQEGAILADEMSLGKSMVALRAARAIKARTLIVCPSFVRGVWVDELKKWWPEAAQPGAAPFLPTGVKPPTAPLAAGGVVVIHYDIVYAWVESLIAWGFKTLILDEGQYLRGERSRRTTACAKLAEHASFKWILTGTPIENNPRDLWGLVNTIRPGGFGKLFTFALRHCDAHREQVTPEKTVWKLDGASNTEELRDRITYSTANPTGFMLRRRKSDVALELPARTRQILELEVPRAKLIPTTEAMRSDKTLRHALSQATDLKVPLVIDLVADHLSNGHKVVVGCHRKAIAHLIHDGVRQKQQVTSGVLTGELPLKKRQALIAAQPDLLCCTIDATAVGIDLSFASVAVVAELDYLPNKLAQWEARFGRYQGRNVLVQYAIARGTADDIIRKAILGRLDVFEKLVGKNDGRLREDLEAIDGPNAVARLQAFCDRLLADD